jgi:surface polysaccharide O-acyltransferase-like enzyme
MNVSVSFLQCTKAPAAVSTPVTSDYVFYKVIISVCFSLMFVTYCGYVKYCTFNAHGSVHRKNILIYTQQEATLHSLFYLETALHVSGGTPTHHQERKQLYLQHLVFVTPLLLSAARGVFVTPLLLPAAITAGSSNGVTNTRCWRYSCLHS